MCVCGSITILKRLMRWVVPLDYKSALGGAGFGGVLFLLSIYQALIHVPLCFSTVPVFILILIKDGYNLSLTAFSFYTQQKLLYISATESCKGRHF